MAFIKRLHLVNFRNYEDKVFDFSSGVNLIVGPNAVGKTNLLEAIFLLISSFSFRAFRNEQMVTWQKGFALIEAKTNLNILKIKLIKQGSRLRKEFFIDEVKRTRKRFLEAFSGVVFQPEEMRLIIGSPARRRNCLDQTLSSLDWQYRQSNLVYKRALKRRNKLLVDINLSKASKQELFYWDQTLIKNGEIIRQKRIEFFDFINDFFQNFFGAKLANLECSYEFSLITPGKLEERFSFDLSRGTTSIGPHRDDFVFLNQEFKNGDNRLANWGSRGQQRMAILAFKIGQAVFVEKKQKEKPILLLDDIFSEFDEKFEELAFFLINHYQTMITSTSKDHFFLKQAKLFDLA